MKFKENAIKPGMVIHCPKKEDAKALLEHLEELGFMINEKDITHPEFEWSVKTPNGVCYAIDGENSWSWGRCKESAEADGLTYAEFSDLIEPENSTEMSAVEVLEWFSNTENRTIAKIFGGWNDMHDILEHFTATEAVGKITVYEAAKEEKPVEVEFGWRIEVYEENGDLWNGDSFWLGYTREEVESIAKRVAVDCVRQTGKSATWSVIDACQIASDACQIKEDK